jgi:alpha-beta hydrolase superfamily lysophospholipase
MANFSASDGTNIYEKVWNASGTPIGSIALLHGFGEHIGRYEHVAAALSAGGFHVRGSDLRGHGQSGGTRNHCDRFGQYLDDLGVLITRVRESARDLPVFVVAHSFGGLIATRYLIDRPDGITGVMLSSPYYGLKLQVPAIKVIAGKVMTKIWGSFSQPNGLMGKDCSRDPEVARAYDADPLNTKKATARWFTETADAQAFVVANAQRLTLPLLMMAGGDDRLVDTAVSEQVFAKVGSTDKTLEVLPGQYHEIFNELAEDRKKTLQRVVTWLKEHASASSGKLRAQGA